MVHAGLASDGARGFPAPIAKYLASRYGFAGTTVPALRERACAILELLRARLGDRPYFGGDRPDARDVYAAAFLTPLGALTEEDCPAFRPSLRAGFAAAADELGPLVPPQLVALRTRMREEHLGWPIIL
jgi:glutathione S-transferase